MNRNAIIDMGKLKRHYRSVMGIPEPAPAPEPVSPYGDSTFADLVLTELPDRLRSAESKFKAGFGDDADADIAYVRDFTSKYRNELSDFASFRGTNGLGVAMAKGATALLEESYMTRLDAVRQDPAVRRRAAERSARALGGGDAMTDMFVGVDNGDPEAIMLASVYQGLKPAAPKPAPRGVGTEAPPAAPVPGADPVKFPGYVRDSRQLLTSGLSEDTLSAFGAVQTFGTLGKLFTAGDYHAGGALSRIVNKAARAPAGADPLQTAATLASAADTVTAAVDAFGAAGDPMRSRTAAAVLEALQDLGPADSIIAQRQKLNTVMADTAMRMEAQAARGFPMDDAAASLYARTRYQSTGGGPLGPAEARLAKTLGEAQSWRNAIVMSPIDVATGAKGAPEPGLGYGILARIISGAVDVGEAAAAVSGTGLAGQRAAVQDAIARGFEAIGGGAEGSQALAAVVAQALEGGETVSVASLPQLLGREPAPPAPEGPRDRVLGNALQRAYEAEPVAASDGTPRTEAERLQAAEKKVRAPGYAEDLGLNLQSAVMRVDPATVDLFTRGFGDRNATMRNVEEALEGDAKALLGDQSPAFRYAYEEVPVRDLGKEETKAEIRKRFLAEMETRNPLLKRGIDSAAADEAANAYATALVKSLKDTAAASGAGGSVPLLTAVGTEAGPRKEAAEKAGAVAFSPEWAGRVLSRELKMAWRPMRTERLLSRFLAQGFLKDVAEAVPEDRRGFAAKAHEKVMKLSRVQAPPAEPEAPPKWLNELGAGGPAGLKAARETAELLDKVAGRPIRDQRKARLAAEFTGMIRGVALPGDDMTLAWNAMIAASRDDITPEAMVERLAKAAGLASRLKSARAAQDKAAQAKAVQAAKGGINALGADTENEADPSQ